MKVLSVIVGCLLASIVAVQADDRPRAEFYEDSDCSTDGSSWIVFAGSYSKSPGEKYQALPFPNDEVTALDLPKGWSVYMTDGAWFDPEDNQVIWYEAKDRDLKCVPIGHKGGLMGVVSSVTIWETTRDATPDEVLAKRPSLLPGEGMADELPKAVFWEDSDCTSSNSWTVQVGVYTEGGEKYDELPFQNDEVRAVDLPKGLSAYMTDGRRFDPEQNETVLLAADDHDLKCVPIGHDKGLSGQVSSLALWDHDSQPTPSVVPSK